MSKEGDAMDRTLRTVALFTALYGCLAVALLAGQPTVGRTQTADAGGKLDAPGRYFLKIQVASAE